MDMVRFICVLSLLSTLAALTKAPDQELYQANRQHDPFSLSSQNPLLSMHQTNGVKIKEVVPVPPKSIGWYLSSVHELIDGYHVQRH